MFLDKPHQNNRADRWSTAVGQHGMVATSHPLAVQAGIDTLNAGGHAVDAAIAANAVLGVVEPMSCGIGGDLFAVVWSEKDKRLFGLNGSGRSPYDWSLQAAEKLRPKVLPELGPLSWSVPGCVSGWEALLAKFGRVKLGKLLEKAIVHAREGFPVTEVVAGIWDRIDFRASPTITETFSANGRSPKFGDIFRNDDLATTLELLAREDAGAFYEGEIAERIVKYSESVGGKLSMKDFADRRADWTLPVSTSYRGYDLWELPPNGQGIAVLQMMNILEQFDIGSLAPNSAEQLHLFIEAKKLAFEDRAVYYADTGPADSPVPELISKEYAKERATLVDRKKAAQQVPAGRLAAPANTVYVTAADREGNMVSLIQSIFNRFGSHEVPDRLGFALQNRGSSFSLDPDHPNRLEPHKRPFHTIAPAFVTKDNRPCLSFGVVGRDFQPQVQAQILMNLIDYDMSPQQAGEQARVGHIESSTPQGATMIDGGRVVLEEGVPSAVGLKLRNLGHVIARDQGPFGGYQGIWRQSDPLRYFGGSDPRKDGCAIGY